MLRSEDSHIEHSAFATYYFATEQMLVRVGSSSLGTIEAFLILHTTRLDSVQVSAQLHALRGDFRIDIQQVGMDDWKIRL